MSKVLSFVRKVNHNVILYICVRMSETHRKLQARDIWRVPAWLQKRLMGFKIVLTRLIMNFSCMPSLLPSVSSVLQHHKQKYNPALSITEISGDHTGTGSRSVAIWGELKQKTFLTLKYLYAKHRIIRWFIDWHWLSINKTSGAFPCKTCHYDIGCTG